MLDWKISKTDLRSKHCRASAIHFFSRAPKLVTNAVSRSKQATIFRHTFLSSEETHLVVGCPLPPGLQQLGRRVSEHLVGAELRDGGHRAAARLIARAAEPSEHTIKLLTFTIKIRLFHMQ